MGALLSGQSDRFLYIFTLHLGRGFPLQGSESPQLSSRLGSPFSDSTGVLWGPGQLQTFLRSYLPTDGNFPLSVQSTCQICRHIGMCPIVMFLSQAGSQSPLMQGRLQHPFPLKASPGSWVACLQVETISSQSSEGSATTWCQEDSQYLLDPYPNTATWHANASPKFVTDLKKKILWCGPFLKSLLNLLQCCFCFPFCILGRKVCAILAFPPGTPCTGRWILNHWTTRKVPLLIFSKYRGSYFYINKFRIFLPSWSVLLSFYIENAPKSEICCSSGKDFQWKA